MCDKGAPTVPAEGALFKKTKRKSMEQKEIGK